MRIKDADTCMGRFVDKADINIIINRLIVRDGNYARGSQYEQVMDH